MGLGCFHTLVIVNSGTMNIGVHVSFQISVSVFAGYMFRNGIAGSYGSSFLVQGTSILFSIVAVPIYIPTNSVEGFLFSTPSPASIMCRLFGDCHPDRCEVIPHCSFDLHFSNDWWCWASFHVFVGNLCIFFGEMSI